MYLFAKWTMPTPSWRPQTCSTVSWSNWALSWKYSVVHHSPSPHAGTEDGTYTPNVNYFTTKMVKSLRLKYSPLAHPSHPRSTMSTWTRKRSSVIDGTEDSTLSLNVDYFTTKLVKSLQFEYSPLVLPSCPRSERTKLTRLPRILQETTFLVCKKKKVKGGPTPWWPPSKGTGRG